MTSIENKTKIQDERGQIDRTSRRQTEVSRRHLPCGASQPGSVRPPLLSWAVVSSTTMLLCPRSELLHSATTHNSSLWNHSSPGHSSQCLNTVPCWAPTLSPALAAQPEATNSQCGQRGHAGIQGVTHMKAHTHTHILNLHEDEHTPPY